jgi:voltage-gated potassium channel Kch
MEFLLLSCGLDHSPCFPLAGEPAPQQSGGAAAGSAYFSYITLTTTGYGDITPFAPLTRTLAMFEALTGQLYLAIMLARLVSPAIMGQKDNLYGQNR